MKHIETFISLFSFDKAKKLSKGKTYTFCGTPVSTARESLSK